MKKLFQALLFTLLLSYPLFASAGCSVGWDTYTDPTATEFRLYINSTTAYIRISPITLTSYAIVDSYLTQVKNNIYITAYDAVNVRESAPSNTVTWTKGLAPPQILRITIP